MSVRMATRLARGIVGQAPFLVPMPVPTFEEAN